MGSVAAGALLFSERFRAHPRVQAALGRLPFREVLSRVRAALYVYRSRPRLLGRVVLLSLAAQLATVVSAAATARALGGGADLGTFFYIVPLAHLALSIPVGLPGGLGQSEIVYRELLEAARSGLGLPLALLQRVNWALWALAGGVYHLMRCGPRANGQELADRVAGLLKSTASGPSPKPMKPART